MTKVFQKRQWRRRILIRLTVTAGIIVLVLGGIALWVVRALPGIAALEISRLANTRVQMGPLHFHRNASVSIDGLKLLPPRQQLFYEDTAILEAKTVSAKFSWASLFFLSPKVREIHVRDFILDVQYDLDSGRWNVGELRFNRPPSGGRKGTPTFYLEGGKLRYSKLSTGESLVVMSLPIEARLGPDDASPQSYAFDVKTSRLSGGYGDSSLRGTWRPGRVVLAGGLSSTDIPSLERAWAVDVLAADLTYDSNDNYKFDLRLKDVHSKHSPEIDTFRAAAPPKPGESNPLAMVQQFFARYQPFGTLSEINVTATGRLNALEASEITGQVWCKDVSVCDRQFPYPIDHLSGPIEFTRSLVRLNGLTAKHGEANLIIDGWTKGSGDGQQYVLHVTSDNMVLDEPLYAALQRGPKQMWDAFSPRGVVDVDYWMSQSSPSETTNALTVNLHGVTATYKSFAYPLLGLTGRLYFDHDDVTISNVVATGSGHGITLNGKVIARDPNRPVYNVKLDANDIPLDKTLGDVLPPAQRDLYRHFDSVGTADISARVFTSADGNNVGPVSFVADVTLDKAALRVPGLPDPITDIGAAATVTPDSLSVAKAVGRYGPSPVSLAGGMRFAPDGQPRQYDLKIAAQQMSLSDKIFQALPDPVKPSVAGLHVEGTADVNLEFAKADGSAPPEYRVVVKCLGDTVKHDRFPYPLSDVQGTIAADQTAVTLTEIKAKPALQPEPDLNPAIQIDGRLPLAKSSKTPGELTVRAKDILFNTALGDAVPKNLAGAYRDLAPRGPFDLEWRATKITRDANDRTLVAFDGRVDFRTCSLSLSGTGAELVGTLGLQGTYDTNTGLSDGQLRLAADRLTIKDKDFTNLKASIVYDPNSRVWSAENFLGNCYEGRVLGDLSIAPVESGVMQYLATVAFNRVNLEPFLLGHRVADAGQKNASSGTMNASLSLGARIGDGSSRLGACKIHVVDMQVGKVSPLAKLLAVLSLTEPSDYTFERMLIESYLRRSKLLIDKFDLAGKNVTFAGNGSMDLLNNNVNLTLTARGKRVSESRPSMFQSLTEGLGGAVVRMEVTGKVDNPQVETKTLPVIEDSLKILGTPK